MLFSSAFVGRELPVGSGSPSPNWSLRIWEVADRKSASSSISSPPPCAAFGLELVWLAARSGACGEGLGATGAAAASSLFRTIALKVPVAAVHSGLGGGSTKNWLTSAVGLNSSAASGMESSSSISARIEAGGGFGAGGAAEEGCGRASGVGGLADCAGFGAAVSGVVGARFNGPAAGACCGRVGATDAGALG